MNSTEKNSPVLETAKVVARWARKWTAQAGLLFLCALSVSAAFLGITVAVERLSAPIAYNAGAGVLSIVICTMLYYGCFSEEKGADKSIRLFMLMLVCDAVLQFLDPVTFLMDGIAELRTLNLISNTLYFLIADYLMYLLWRYIRVYLPTNSTLARRLDRVMVVVLVPELLCALANLFVPIFFYADEQGTTYATDISMLSSSYILALFICATLYFVRVKAPLRNKIVLSLYYILPVASIVTYYFVDTGGAYLPDAPLISITLMYVVLVSERSKKLAATSAELDMATRIQANMLPNTFPAFPKRKEFELYATMDPAKEVGGDFYDFFLVDDDHLALVMADVSGKGVPAALFMMTARTLIKDAALEGLDPSSVMFRVNERLDENNKDGLFVTVWLGILELSTGELTYSDAGHEKLLLYQQGAWRFLPKGGCTALAVLEPDEFDDLPESYRYRNETIQLQPGDMLFQYTDGVTEATDAQEELFGDERLLNAMKDADDNAPESLLPHVRRRIDEFVKDAPQFDDITMLGLRYLGRGIE